MISGNFIQFCTPLLSSMLPITGCTASTTENITDYLLTLLTAGHVSRRTVSMPLASYVGSVWSGHSYIKPTYLFFVCRTHGRYTCNQ